MTHKKIGPLTEYVEAPTDHTKGYWDDRPSLFLAGGITGCWNWQERVASELGKSGFDGIIYNPRREQFDVKDPYAAHNQITWEYNHLKKASAILFWFSSETVQPIVLFELGRWSFVQNKPIFVGVDRAYERRNDVVLQMMLTRPDLVIVDELQDLVEQVLEWADRP